MFIQVICILRDGQSVQLAESCGAEAFRNRQARNSSARSSRVGEPSAAAVAAARRLRLVQAFRLTVFSQPFRNIQRVPFTKYTKNIKYTKYTKYTICIKYKNLKITKNTKNTKYELWDLYLIQNRILFFEMFRFVSKKSKKSKVFWHCWPIF